MMMVQGAQYQSPRFAMPTEAHMQAAPGANSFTGPVPQGTGTTSRTATASAPSSDTPMQPPSTLGKRKAEAQDNERLSKRLSLLNLEHGRNKLYVPVETPQVPNTTSQPTAQPSESMELDNSKHKVYIYNLDDELSSESEDEEGKLIFLPDIEKHLRESRIPQQVLANKEGELAGMELVLYREPKSLLVPKDQETLEREALQAKQKANDKQKLAQEGASHYAEDDEAMDMD